MHEYRDDVSTLLRELEKHFIPTGPPPQYPDYPYVGEANELLDADITSDEVRVVLQDLRRNTAPGADHIRFATLRNLSDADINHLTHIFNDCWRKGMLPQAWRHADITLIPKPGKPVKVENLRPISLTSCIGKLMEHVLLRRLQPFLEEKSFFSNSQFGYRAHLSAKDVLLQLREEVIGPPSSAQTRALIALDLKGAFDNVEHDLILRNVAHSHCGIRMYNYIRAFLRDRTATVGMGPHRSGTIRLVGRGTPQGSVLSPTLFNIALAGLPRLLDQIPDVAHAIYADDITIWSTRGSDGAIQDRLQQAVDTVSEYARKCGLRCAPEKSELIIIRPRSRSSTPPITVHVDGTPIPQVNRARILGLHVQADGRSNYTVSLLSRQIEQILAMIRRVSNRRSGLREEDLLRLVEACVISRLTYHLPFQRLTQAQQLRIDAMIRKATKLAHGLPNYTSTRRLLNLGTHNTLGELLEAHWVSHRQRLLLTPTGRHLLTRLGYSVPPLESETRPTILSSAIRQALSIHPLPRNMHPEHDKGRRKARVRYIGRMLANIPETHTLYTDTSRTQEGYTSVVLDGTESLRDSAAMRGTNAAYGEILGVALAIRYAIRVPEEVYILTDSQQACRAFLSGHGIPRAAHQILKQIPQIHQPHLPASTYSGPLVIPRCRVTNAHMRLPEKFPSGRLGVVRRLVQSGGIPCSVTKTYSVIIHAFVAPTPHHRRPSRGRKQWHYASYKPQLFQILSLSINSTHTVMQIVALAVAARPQSSTSRLSALQTSFLPCQLSFTPYATKSCGTMPSATDLPRSSEL